MSPFQSVRRRRPGMNPGRILRTIFITLRDGFDSLLNTIFAINLLGGIMRFVVIVLGGLFIWIAVAVYSHPVDQWLVEKALDSFKQALLFFTSEDMVYTLLAGGVKTAIYGGIVVFNVIKAMFAADIFRHVLAISIPIFLAVRISTLYLKDIFEVERERTAFRFITRAAFALWYQRIVIENGSIRPKDEDTPLYRIGGPGLVQVNLENLAVFERMDGQPHIIPPTTRRRIIFPFAEVLESFERLRDVIDLRDQMAADNKLEVEGRTRDGIPIKAKNIRYLFSVKRSSAPALPGQLTFDRDAILKIVYERGRGAWSDDMRTAIRTRLKIFILERNLSEFLAAAALPPAPPARLPASPPPPPLNFEPRPNLTGIFGPNFGERDGLQLHWIDVGTWVTPSSIIPERHREAWQITSENEVRRRSRDHLRLNSRIEELLRLIRAMPLRTFRVARAQGRTDKIIWATLMEAYLGVLRTARDSYVTRGVTAPVELDASINFLGQYINEFLENEGIADFLP